MVGPEGSGGRLEAMIRAQEHRGPDDQGSCRAPGGRARLGHNRLSIIDLSPAGHQPMQSTDGRYWITFNGEIYNYIELRRELSAHRFEGKSDTEVLLAAFAQWGPACLDRLIGMFAFAVWDEERQELFAARDRFGVKPLFVHRPGSGGVVLSSEIKAMQAIGIGRAPDPVAWSTYLTFGLYDHASWTFWAGIERVPPGGWLRWSQDGGVEIGSWYDAGEVVARAGEDERSEETVLDEAAALFEESARLRFRADVPVGVCLSGGLDSSLLLGLIHRVGPPEGTVEAYTFECGDPKYDESPWVEQMLAGSEHPWIRCVIDPSSVPERARLVQAAQDEPFGGIPTLGMAAVFAAARDRGVLVLLDANGIDEAWGGYDYYARAGEVDPGIGPVQGSRDRSVRPDLLLPPFCDLAQPFELSSTLTDPLRRLQYRDLRFTKIPRATRFIDRVSMMHSTEVREPALDHRIVELGLRQPASRKFRNGEGKWLMRQLARRYLPREVREAPKRAVQSPQREWLRGPLADWAAELVEEGLEGWGTHWLRGDGVRAALREYRTREADNSFPLWQWISLGLMQRGSLGSI